MTKEEKQLLLKDLCARLPYEVKVKSSRRREPVTLSLDVMTDFHLGCSIKPYLRPLESMTEEEKIKYCNLQDRFHTDIIIEGKGSCIKYYSNIRPFKIIYPTKLGDSIDTIKIGTYNTYEQAAEAAIKYCLTNLI